MANETLSTLVFKELGSIESTLIITDDRVITMSGKILSQEYTKSYEEGVAQLLNHIKERVTKSDGQHDYTLTICRTLNNNL